MTDMTTDETPENRTDLETRLTQIEEAIRELRDVLERQNQTRQMTRRTRPRNPGPRPARGCQGDRAARLRQG